ncbi:hypothetical protein [Burkholderia territorii]|nr:hypothetical protein [Burkholderia territorii]
MKPAQLFKTPRDARGMTLEDVANAAAMPASAIESEASLSHSGEAS